MEPSFSDYRERRKIISEIYPPDLLEDLKESEPELYNEAQDCDNHIADFVREMKQSVAPKALLPSVLTKGWNRTKKHKFNKNWADMENLLKLYALSLYFKGQALPYQAQVDKAELTDAVEAASVSQKHKNGIPAQKRLAQAKTYLRFGQKTLDVFFAPDSDRKGYDMEALNREIYETSNEYNAEKLRKSKEIALSVGRFICKRYKV